MTTRDGYRKSQIAKKYIQEVKRKTGRTLNLRQARTETAAIESIIKALSPLNQSKKIKVMRAAQVLLGVE